MIYKFLEYISNIGVNDNLPPDAKTKLININRLIIFVTTIGLLNFFYDLTNALFFYCILDLIVCFLLLFFLFLNFIGYYKLVSNFLILFLNIITFVAASSGGRETIFFLYFFPIMILSFFLFGIKEKKLLVIYTFIPICLLIFTILTDFSLFLDPTLTSKEIKYIFWANLINLILCTFYGLMNIIHLNSDIENNLVKNKANLNAIFNNSLLYIVLLDQNKKVKAFNKLAKDFFYQIYSREILINDDILNFIPKQDKNKFILNFYKTTLGQNIKAERRVKFQNNVQWFEIYFNPTYNENNIINGVIFSIIEITDHKKSEFNIKQERQKAEAANAHKSYFLSNISQEIRTPMNSIIGMTGMLLENNPKKDQIENLKILKYSAQNLLVIINDILDFNRIDSGNIEFEKVEFNLKYLIDTISNLHSNLIYEKPINFVTKYDERIPTILIGDSVRLSQILTNLINNAIKFTNDGTVSLDIQLEELATNYTDVGFAVTDTGIGISEDNIDYIFESFSQDSRIYTNFGTTGLELAITKRLLEFQNSTIFVESELGRGSKFYFSLRFEYNKTELLNSNFTYSQKTQLQNHHLLKGLQILLVEDYAINQIVALEFLSKWKVELDIAENGVNALEKFKTKKYDIILMDLQMPEMDGYETTRRIRMLEKSLHKKTPIIALTASAISEIRNRIMEAGMDDSISKPFNPDDLFNKILKYTEIK